MRKIELLSAIGRIALPASFLACAGFAYGAGHEVASEDPYARQIQAASNAGEEAIGHIKVPKGLKVELWAAEPMLANPVCIRADNKDRVYCIETFRHTSNVLDIRGHMDWLVDDLACRTVADRVAMLRRKMGPNIRQMTRDDDRIRLIQDDTGSGKADKATIFASGFNSIESGLAAGVLPYRGSVYFTDIPSLYLLKDTTGDGAADVRKELSTGYGVHITFLGHDLHGLRIGPDRKLYFSIGDRGTNAKSLVDGSTIYAPDTGGVFRCDLDGSHLEIFATGLRNPQQLCFDNFGNLFTGDNNPDYGDPARWVYVVEGGDSGWRSGYQEARLPRGGGPWMWESLWQTSDKLKDAAYIVPCVAPLGSGPSGVAHYPGTSFPEKYNDHFFMVDFRGGSAQSLIHCFALKPKGATYSLTDHSDFLRGLLPTDIDFSPRGGMYVSDWTEGWNKTGRGRIYRVFSPEAQAEPIVAEVRKLLADGFEKRSDEELVKLMSHRDQRVRQEAQFALADRGAAAIPVFALLANKGSDQLARLHAIWGLGELARKTPSVYSHVVPLLSDRDAEVRAQAAKVLGDGHVQAAFDGLVKLLGDSEARPKFFAAIALGHLGRPAAIEPLLAMIRENADKDPLLRHAGVMGLLGSGDMNAVISAAKDPSSSVRLAVLLTLRRLHRPEIAMFLNDSDPHLVSEAAHAINDAPVDPAMPQLAALLERPNLPDTVLLRAVNAAYRVGTPQTARLLAAFAGRPGAPDFIRIEALRDLGNWAEPSPLDRIMNLYRPLPNRPEEVARQAAGLAISQILHPSESGAKVPAKVRVAAVNLIQKLKINDTAVLFDLASGESYPPELRAQAVMALADRNDQKLADAVKIALADKSPILRQAAIRALAKLPGSTPELSKLLQTGTVGEQQAALAALGQDADGAATQIISQSMDKLLAGQWKPQLELDLLEAARTRPELQAKIEKYESTLPKNDPLAPYRVALQGGNAESGRAVFQRPDASCIRCHTVHHEGGAVGPVLDGVGTRQTREYLLESIVFPNAKIAPGFETAVIKLKDGRALTGIVKAETPAELTLVDVDNQKIKIDKSQIASRTRGPSAMPEGFGTTLSKHDLRDLVEYLAELKK